MNTRLSDRKYEYYHKQWHAIPIPEATTVRFIRHYNPTPRMCVPVGAESINFVCVQTN